MTPRVLIASEQSGPFFTQSERSGSRNTRPLTVAATMKPGVNTPKRKIVRANMAWGNPLDIVEASSEGAEKLPSLAFLDDVRMTCMAAL